MRDPEDFDFENAPEDASSEARVSFGFREVGAREKAGLVATVFDSVAPRYDLMNDLMSGGLHRLWRGRLMARLSERPVRALLDLAGGTGDIAFRVLKHGRTLAETQVTVCDINAAMLDVGRDQAWNRGFLNRLSWLCADAERLPLRGGAMDACTIAFGIRNVTDMPRALKEIARVLEPGGRFLCLELSPSVLPILQKAYDAYSFELLPRIGGLVTGDGAAYRYLAESIRRFPPPERFMDLVRGAGFGGVRSESLAGGVAVLTTAWRV